MSGAGTLELEVDPISTIQRRTVFTSLALMAPAAHFAFGFWWLWFLIPVFWILVFVLVFGFFGRRWRRAAWEHRGMHHHPGRSAESTLAERFAQGDIDEKEYRARLEVLRANAPARS